MIHAACKAPVAILACSLMLGCRASASAKAEINTAKSEDAVKWDEPAAATASKPPQELALLGARHDVRLASEGKSATCSCVAVVLGSPGDPALAWRSEVPQIDPASQLVVALSSDGLPCQAATKDSLGASYWGYKQAGNDVIVVVEAARSGTPVTAGAIIPKPGGAGQVYLQPLSRSTPYGRPLAAGEHLCRLGNPGPARNTPVSPAPAAPQQPEPESDPEPQTID
jgi:hypothetical protein